jgi:hypothetical protein
MEIKIHDSGPGRDEDRFTVHAAMRADVTSVSAVEIDIEAYGPTEDVARQRLRDVARELAEELLTLAN